MAGNDDGPRRVRAADSAVDDSHPSAFERFVTGVPLWAWIALAVLFLLVVFVAFAQAFIIIRLQGQNHLTKMEVCRLYLLTHNRIPSTCIK